MTSPLEIETPRRTALKAGAVATTATLMATGGSETVHAADGWETDLKSNEITISYDEDTLRTFQPRLIMEAEPARAHKGMYGYLAKYPQYDTYACCYWNQFTHQNGLPLIGADSHLGDHEPLYIFVDAETDEVEAIRYSAYHWYVGTADGRWDVLHTDRADYPTHTNFHVVPEWHNHAFVAEPDPEGAAFYPLESWIDVRDRWKQNGFYEPAQPEAIEQPWTMLERDAWWRDGSTDALFAGIWASIAPKFGLFGADESDEWGQ